MSCFELIDHEDVSLTISKVTRVIIDFEVEQHSCVRKTKME